MCETKLTDLFSDRPLIYERTSDGYRFYSVGENGIDKNCQTFADTPVGDDMIIQFPAPPRAPAR